MLATTEFFFLGTVIFRLGSDKLLLHSISLSDSAGHLLFWCIDFGLNISDIFCCFLSIVLATTEFFFLGIVISISFLVGGFNVSIFLVVTFPPSLLVILSYWAAGTWVSLCPGLSSFRRLSSLRWPLGLSSGSGERERVLSSVITWCLMLSSIKSSAFTSSDSVPSSSSSMLVLSILLVTTSFGVNILGFNLMLSSVSLFSGSLALMLFMLFVLFLLFMLFLLFFSLHTFHVVVILLVSPAVLNGERFCWLFSVVSFVFKRFCWLFLSCDSFCERFRWVSIASPLLLFWSGCERFRWLFIFPLLPLSIFLSLLSSLRHFSFNFSIFSNLLALFQSSNSFLSFSNFLLRSSFQTSSFSLM